MSQFLNAQYEDSKMQSEMEKFTMVSFALLVGLNMGFVLWLTAVDCKAKRMKKAWLARKKKYEES